MAESGLPPASVKPPDPATQTQPPAYSAQTAPTLTAYPPAGGYPPPQPSYLQGGYPPQPGYQPGSYPPQPGYPPAGYVQPAGGYPPGAYPPPQPGTTNVMVVGGQPTTVIEQKKEGVNHALHFVISLFFWPWLIVWLILCITEEA